MSATIQFSLRSERKPAPPASAPAALFAVPDAAPATTTPRAPIAPIPLPPSRPDVGDDVPLLLRNVNPDVLAAADQDKCRIDMATRPDAPDQAAYDRVPVHEFGYALMAGMGWSKGAPIGRSNPQVVEPFEYVRRPHLLGLGAAPAPAALDLPSMTGRKRRKKDAADLVDAKTGKTRYTKKLDEVLVERDRPIGAGVRVRIERGPYTDLTAVVNIIDDGVAEVALDLNQKPVRVAVGDLARTDAVNDIVADNSPGRRRPLTWVVPGIVVRIVSKSQRWQRWYSCKGRVYDVASLTEFSIVVEDGALVDGLAEADVETVVPDRPGVRLRVVGGRHKGAFGRLYRRQVDKGRAKIDLDSGERVSARLDDVTLVAE